MQQSQVNDLPIVSVIIPAHNAEATLSATLESVVRQTYRNLEIIVVDDGSTDGTREVAENAARRYGRIRVISCSNGGVANARNVGVARSRGAFVAPIDADDLWHPEKIARQMEVMKDGGPTIGFVYTFYRRIDDADNILYNGSPWRYEGACFLRMIIKNFVGNGSSLLIRRCALESVGGYEPHLHHLGVQGCEDYLVQLMLARRWGVAVVPEYLTGYRLTPDAMSANRERMERSHLLMFDVVKQRFPETSAKALAIATASARMRLAFIHLLIQKRPVRAAREMARAYVLHPGVTLAIAKERAPGVLRRVFRRAQPPVAVDLLRFKDADPRTGSASVKHVTDPWIMLFADLEDAFRRTEQRHAEDTVAHTVSRHNRGPLTNGRAMPGAAPLKDARYG